MHWRRKWQPTPVFLPGESQGQESLVGCRLWGRTESDTTEVSEQQQQQCRRTWFDSWVEKMPCRRDRLPTPGFLGFPCGSAGKESTRNAGDLGLIPGLGRSPGEGKGYPLRHSGLENSMDCIVHRRRRWHPTPVLLPGKSQGWGSLVGCRLWGRTESDTTEVT